MRILMSKQQNVLVIFEVSPFIILKKPENAVEYTTVFSGFLIYKDFSMSGIVGLFDRDESILANIYTSNICT